MIKKEKKTVINKYFRLMTVLERRWLILVASKKFYYYLGDSNISISFFHFNRQCYLFVNDIEFSIVI